MIFKQLIANIWLVFDVLMFLAFVIAFNLGGFYFGQGWGYLTLALTFAVTGVLVEQIQAKTGGGDA